MRQSDDSGHEQDSVDQLIDDYTARKVTRRQFFQRSAGLGISLSVAGALLAACGGNNEDRRPAGGGHRPRRHRRPKPAPPARPSRAAASRCRAGSSSRATTVTSPSWTRCSRTGPTPAFVAIYEFTVVRDADGAYQPALVDSWEVSDDLLTWTFKIRDGLTFQSGAPLDAQVIADNFNAFRDAHRATWAGPGRTRSSGRRSPTQGVRTRRRSCAR